MSLFRDRAVVLRTYRLGEADRIVVLLGEGHGKVRAVAKGVRRTASKYGARLEPLSHVSLMAWRGRGELATVNQVEVVDAFRTVREDLERMMRATWMLEAADQLAQEDHQDAVLYRMLVGALRVLNDPRQDPTLIAPAFFLKALVAEGAGPILDMCAACGEPDGVVELVAFDLLDGGALCRRCRHGRPVSAEALALARQIVGGSLTTVLAARPPAAAQELTALATEAMESHLERRLRSVRSAGGI